MLACFLRAEGAADIGRPLTVADGLCDRRLDCRGLAARAEIVEHHRRRQDRADRIGHVLPGERRRRAVHRLEHRRPAGMEIARRSQPQSALQRRAEVRDDVTEEVVGDDDLELRGILDQEQRERIDIDVPRLDPRVLRSKLREHPLPQGMAVGHGVALVGHAQPPAAVRFRVLERVAHDPVDALVGIDLFLNRDFVGSAGLEPAADANVEALGVLAEDDEVHVGRRPVLQRT